MGIDYARPILVKYEPVCKPHFTKGHFEAIVCLETKAVHLKLISNLITFAFIATLQRFTGHQEFPTKLWSNHKVNFFGAERERTTSCSKMKNPLGQ